MRNLYGIIFLLLIISYQLSSTYAQEILYSHSKEEVSNNSGQSSTLTEKQKEKSNFNYRLNMGTSIYSGSFGNAFYTFVEPELQYRLNPKWSISTGLLITQSNFGNLFSENNHGNALNSYFTASLAYNATDRLRIKGEILYGMNKSPIYGYKRNAEYSVRFGAAYKITDKLTFEVEIINQKTNNILPFGSIYYNNGFLPVQ